MTKRSIRCTHCSKEFVSSGPRAMYCSLRCKRKVAWQRERQERENSGNPMKPHGGNHTGNTGADHYAFKDGIGMFKMRLNKEYKNKVKMCERCSKDLQNVMPQLWCVHHKDHNRSNNVESNFELLCKRCHQVEHECWRAFNGYETKSAETIPKGSTLQANGSGSA